MDTQQVNARDRLFEGTGSIVYGGRFVGRKNDIRRIQDRVVYGHGNIAIIGMPRIGKTSLAWHTLMNDKDTLFSRKLIPVFIESASVKNDYDYLSLMLEEAKESIEDLIELDLPDSKELETIFLNELQPIAATYYVKPPGLEKDKYFKKFFKQLKKKTGYTFIFILDEFDRAEDILSFATFQLLREVSINPKSKVSFVTTSRKTIEEIESKDGSISNFHGTFTQLYLGVFNEEDIHDYWERTKSAIIFPEKVCDSIGEFVGGHPYFMDLCCIQYLFNCEIEDLYDSSFKMKMYAELRQIVGILKRDHLLDATIQLVVGPPFDVTQAQKDRLVNYGMIKLIDIEQKSRLLHISITEEERGSKSYVLFGDFFTILFYTQFFLDIPYWPLWGKTENKLREIILFFVKSRYGNNWSTKLEQENKDKSWWLERWETITDRFDEYAGVSNECKEEDALIDFAETGPIFNLFIKRYWDLWFSLIFKETSTNNLNKDNREDWYNIFQKLILLRRPFAHNNTGMLTPEEINIGKQYCEIILKSIEKWEVSKIKPREYDSKKPYDAMQIRTYSGVYFRKTRSVGPLQGFVKYPVQSTEEDDRDLYNEVEVEYEVIYDANLGKRVAINVRIIN